jgi:hypothetical protein
MTGAPISGTQASASSGQQEGARGEVCDDSAEEGTDARADEEDEPLIRRPADAIGTRDLALETNH